MTFSTGYTLERKKNEGNKKKKKKKITSWFKPPELLV